MTIVKIEDQFKSIFQAGFESKSLKKSQMARALGTTSLSEKKLSELTPSIQQILRPIFGKVKPVIHSIGGHPDYDHLKDTDNIEYGQITTLFMDIESSTRLGIIYKPDEVYMIKNAFIQMAIDVIKALDGHVHRIMGDAVMAFFGGKNVKPEDAILDSMNCGSCLVYLVKKSVIPKLEELGFNDSEFGIRIGIDYGNSKEVVWSSYGYSNISEVTATSFFVDVASKLQHQAARNCIMIGQSLVEFLDIHEDLISIKKVQISGEELPEPYVMPNITNAKGVAINYKKYHFNWEKHLSLTAFPVDFSAPQSALLPIVNNSFRLKLEVWNQDKSSKECDYSPGSGFLPKGKYLKFILQLNYLPQLPYTVTFEVENHGKEAKEGADKREDSNPFDNHEKIFTIETAKEHGTITHWEHTLYRGIHYMRILIKTKTRTIHELPFTIFIQ